MIISASLNPVDIEAPEKPLSKRGSGVDIVDSSLHVNDQNKWDFNIKFDLILMTGKRKIGKHDLKRLLQVQISQCWCGDFHSVPESASHALLAMGKVDQMHPDLAVDPFQILRSLLNISGCDILLKKVSTYSSFARVVVSRGLEQRRKMASRTNEPLFTNCTRNCISTHDYIFYSRIYLMFCAGHILFQFVWNSLTVESLLVLLDEDSLRKDTTLPSPEWSDDHIALLVEFRCKHRNRQWH
ncbi:carbon catabolite repressor protein 4 homolog 2-like [Olea europaea var. sylvestris]|uniref:carbon catabolite repressor protein 4 homolog 2-like n=1 Tax=Olea europaea var. sylvestris TaxID=158386 RepID=UPI000C1CD67F|nr:carbon catabolite repressor protein 4 homolog 2-like [Olea europaea var. sylvestris]